MSDDDTRTKVVRDHEQLKSYLAFRLSSNWDSTPGETLTEAYLAETAALPDNAAVERPCCYCLAEPSRLSDACLSGHDQSMGNPATPVLDLACELPGTRPAFQQSIMDTSHRRTYMGRNVDRAVALAGLGDPVDSMRHFSVRRGVSSRTGQHPGIGTRHRGDRQLWQNLLA
jgi:hypothetical protein